jgi:hypothetical protein
MTPTLTRARARAVRLDMYACGCEPRVHSHGDGRGDGDQLPEGVAVPRDSTGRPQHQHRCARQVAGIVASTFIMGTGEGWATLGA